ncbi:uncharacterized protein MELLADRAFT_92061 [Melampsora larici-populina 98AG31]|uniref:Septin-type G domain-containing protein n=1 Tax=Melampsora larici-populina (strain 98AG31 / pathotype 3-4-7) TaxID=747676 RepID=F4S1D9_MELLP|nr:uncharacterized protein MELLADRAFT_92061 [Melampsora larici-populina 98AG31]EGG01545.1 hypothetical protein MELLADRAFT_92061 [Melampsora larici-populina 98AG31]
MTDDEILAFKQRILLDIAFHNIHICEGPQYEKEDEETLAENKELMVLSLCLTFGYAIFLSQQYPSGTVEVDNKDHCDFLKLRQMLIQTHMEELKEHTLNVLYENYGSQKLLSTGVTQDHPVLKEIKSEQSLHEAQLSKMESEMKMVFQQKVAEKKDKLKQSEEELYARYCDMKEALEKQCDQFAYVFLWYFKGLNWKIRNVD